MSADQKIPADWCNQVNQNLAKGLLEPAVQLYKQALEELKKSSLAQDHREVAKLLLTLGNIYLDQKKYEEVESSLKESLAVMKKISKKNHRFTADVLNSMALMYASQDRNEEAEVLYKRALEIYGEVRFRNKYKVQSLSCRGQDKDNTKDLDFATVKSNLANYSVNKGQEAARRREYQRAERYFKRALKIYEAKLGTYHVQVIKTKYHLACCYREQGKYDNVETLCKQVLGSREKILDKDDPQVAEVLNNWGLLYKDHLKYKLAVTSIKEEAGYSSDISQCQVAEECKKTRYKNKRTTSCDYDGRRKAAKVDSVMSDANCKNVDVSRKEFVLPASSQAMTEQQAASLDQMIADVQKEFIDKTQQIVNKKVNVAIAQKNSQLDETLRANTELKFVIDKKSEQLVEAQRIIVERDAEIFQISQSLNEVLGVIVELNSQLDGMKKKGQEAQSLIAIQKDMIVETAQKLAETEKTVEELKVDVVQKDLQLTNAQCTTADVESMIDVKNELIKKSQKTIDTLRAEIAEKTQRLTEAERTVETHGVFCSICLTELPNMIWNACNHVAACSGCVEKLKAHIKAKPRRDNGIACPKCRNPGHPVPAFI